VRLAALALLAGCNLAFGLQSQPPPPADAVPDGPPDAPPDAPAAPIAGNLAVKFVFNGTNYLPTTVRIIYAANQLAITTADASGATTPVPYDDSSGTFIVPRHGTAKERIQLRFGASVYEYQWRLPALDATLVTFGRLGEAFPTVATTLTGSFAPATLDALVVYATGVWGAYGTTVPSAGMYSVAWTGGLVSGAGHDQLIAAGYTADAMGNLVLDHLQALPSVEMISGPNAQAFTLAPVAADSCIKATTNVGVGALRLDTIYAGWGTVPSSALFLVYALVHPELGGAVAWQLARAPNGAANVQLSYSRTAFPGFVPMATTLSQRTRTLATGFPITVEDLRFVPIADTTCNTTAVMPALDGAVPSAFVLDGTPLDSDAVTIHFTTPTATLAWTANGPTDLYQVLIYDTASRTRIGHAYTTTDPSIVLDTAELLLGHEYIMYVTATRGLADLAGGDTATTSYPLERGVGASYAFTIQ